MSFVFRITAILLFITAQAAVSPAAEDSGKLRWKFEKGRSFSYSIEQSMELALTLKSETKTTKVKQSIDLQWTVDDVNADTGDAEMTHTIKRIKIEIDSPATGRLEFDSDAKGEAEGLVKVLSPVLSTLVGSKVRLRMSTRGDINEVRVPADVLGGVQESSRRGDVRRNV